MKLSAPLTASARLKKGSQAWSAAAEIEHRTAVEEESGTAYGVFCLAEREGARARARGGMPGGSESWLAGWAWERGKADALAWGEIPVMMNGYEDRKSAVMGASRARGRAHLLRRWWCEGSGGERGGEG